MTSRPHNIPSQPLTLFAVILCALRAAAMDITKSPDDFFHNGAQAYLSNNIPAALTVITNGRLQYPGDEKLKKLEALLKQQQQRQQNQKQDQQKSDEQKQLDQQKDQSPPSKPDDQQKEQAKPDPQKQGQQPKPDEQKNSGEQPQAATAQPGEQMTPEQAMRVLDTTKGDEKVLPVQLAKPPQSDRKLKDW